MSTIPPRKIVCTACGRTGPFRPEMAGKRVRCKCGNLISVPKVAEKPIEAKADDLSEPLRPEPLPEESDSEGLYDIREEAKPTRPQRATVAAPAADVPASVDSPPPRAPAPNMYPTTIRPKMQEAGQEQSAILRLVLLLAVLGVVIGGAIFGVKKFGGSRHPAGPQLGEDADIQEKIDGEYCKEVHAWFEEDHSRMMGPWSESQALSQADRWTQQGAKRVLAFGSRMSLVAVIELPDDPAKRKQLFDWQADWHERHMQKVWTDVGQKYLMIRLGI
ncbi:MAG TPA: hypothetical protein VGG44_07970 [Tepidisphaeraceae bacterium]